MSKMKVFCNDGRKNAKVGTAFGEVTIDEKGYVVDDGKLDLKKLVEKYDGLFVEHGVAQPVPIKKIEEDEDDGFEEEDEDDNDGRKSEIEKESSEEDEDEEPPPAGKLTENDDTLKVTTKKKSKKKNKKK